MQGLEVCTTTPDFTLEIAAKACEEDAVKVRTLPHNLCAIYFSWVF